MSEFFDGILSAMNGSRIAGAANIRVGQLLARLDGLNDETPVTLTNGEHLDGSWGSYRGYYDDLYIGVDPRDYGKDNVGTLRKILNDALSAGEMTGYKGGEYPIKDSTLLWVSTYGGGDSDATVIDLLTVEQNHLLVVKKVDEE